MWFLYLFLLLFFRANNTCYIVSIQPRHNDFSSRFSIYLENSILLSKRQRVITLMKISCIKYILDYDGIKITPIGRCLKSSHLVYFSNQYLETKYHMSDLIAKFFFKLKFIRLNTSHIKLEQIQRTFSRILIGVFASYYHEILPQKCMHLGILFVAHAVLKI